MSHPITDYIDQHQSAVASLRDHAEQIQNGIDLCADAIARGNKLLLCGNGGSAGDAQHIAAELVGRLVNDRRALPAIALTTDTSALTAIANDYGYDAVFARQLEALGSEGDVLVAISTSGNSANVNLACSRAAKLGCKTLALTGKGGGELATLADVALVVPSAVTAHIQECHILLGHLLCSGIESRLGLGWLALAVPTGGAAVFLDRDGVINEDRGYVSQWSEFKLLPGVLDGLKGLQALGFRLIIVTNQSGIGRGYYTEGDFAKLTTQMIDHFADHGIHVTAVYHCPHHPTEALGGYRQQCRCRKPAPGMIERAVGDWALDPTRCALVGDKPSDMAAGRSAGLSRLFQVTSGEACEGAIGVPDLLAVPPRLEPPKP